MCVGVVLVSHPETSGVGEWVLAFGLFGFAGGFTNWLAVKMLFDQVCLWSWGIDALVVSFFFCVICSRLCLDFV